MRIKGKSVLRYFSGLLAGYCIMIAIFTLADMGMRRNLVHPKNYYDLTFTPVPQNERIPNSVFIGKKNSKPFLEINKSDGKFSFSILDDGSNKVITHEYDKSGLISITGKNWKFTPDQDDIVMTVCK